MFRSSFCSTRQLVSVVAIAASLAGCSVRTTATVGGEDDSYDVDGKADGSAPLRRRATWANKLLTCKAALEESINGATTDGPDLFTQQYADYTTCIARVNDSALARIGRNIADNEQNPYDVEVGKPSEIFADFREKSGDLCESLYGVNRESTSDIQIAQLNVTLCELDAEIAIATRIGDQVEFVDVYDADFNYIPFDTARFLIPTSVPSAVVATCELPEQDMEAAERVAVHMEAECVTTAAKAATVVAVASSIAPSLDQAAAVALSTEITTNLDRMTSAANGLCLVMAAASEVGGGRAAFDAESTCSKAEDFRIAGYIAQYQDLNAYAIAPSLELDEDAPAAN